jgi:hypothetical protein
LRGASCCAARRTAPSASPQTDTFPVDASCPVDASWTHGRGAPAIHARPCVLVHEPLTIGRQTLVRASASPELQPAERLERCPTAVSPRAKRSRTPKHPTATPRCRPTPRAGGRPAASIGGPSAPGCQETAVPQGVARWLSQSRRRDPGHRAYDFTSLPCSRARAIPGRGRPHTRLSR